MKKKIYNVPNSFFKKKIKLFPNTLEGWRFLAICGWVCYLLSLIK